jgi:hypothetical protein
MKQRQREQVQRGCAVGTVVLLAWLCRVLPLEGMPSGLQEACGILRSLLYLSLFAGWGISLYNRTVHPQVRRLLLNVDLLMLFWILVRTLRFQLNTSPGLFCWPHGPFRQKKTGLLHISAGQSCLAARGRRTGFRGFRKGAAQRAVFFSSGASGLFSRFSSGISSLLMMVSICSSFFTSSLGKRLFTRWTTVLR